MAENGGDQKFSVLIVDDNLENLRLLARFLSDEGYRVRVSSNGKHALFTVAKQLPDLILLDIMMPEMDGYEVCRHLKGDERSKHIPILFISALDETIDKVKAFDIGGVDYITKPFQPQEVLARVKTHIALKVANEKLKQMVKDIKTLRGLLPICANCKKIRKSGAESKNQDSWVIIEQYVAQHTHAEFSHGLCPECIQTMYGQEEWFQQGDE